MINYKNTKKYQRSKKFFGDILPEKYFKPKHINKEETKEICRILEEECGIRRKRLAIIGEGKVTE